MAGSSLSSHSIVGYYNSMIIYTERVKYSKTNVYQIYWNTWQLVKIHKDMVLIHAQIHMAEAVCRAHSSMNL